MMWRALLIIRNLFTIRYGRREKTSAAPIRGLRTIHLRMILMETMSNQWTWPTQTMEQLAKTRQVRWGWMTINWVRWDLQLGRTCWKLRSRTWWWGAVETFWRWFKVNCLLSQSIPIRNDKFNFFYPQFQRPSSGLPKNCLDQQGLLWIHFVTIYRQTKYASKSATYNFFPLSEIIHALFYLDPPKTRHVLPTFGLLPCVGYSAITKFCLATLDWKDNSTWSTFTARLYGSESNVIDMRLIKGLMPISSWQSDAHNS